MKASSALAASASDASSIRSHHEIDGELFRLYQLLRTTPALSAFGENNHDAIKVQIAVLRGELNTEQAAELFDNAHQHTLSSALNAAEWLRGDVPAPSEGWHQMAAA